MVPDTFVIPMILVATAATVIASQAVISGAFTVAHQAARLDLMVPLRVVHTSSEEQRQVYLPTVNWLLAGVVILVVVLFTRSQNLTAAYGLAVTVTITMTTTLFLVLCILRRDFSWRFWVAATIWLVVLVFLAANVPKIESGGWLPILIGSILCALMFCWRAGRRQLARWQLREELTLPQFLDIVDAHEITRVEGTGVFFTPSADRIPLALRVMAKHQRALPKQIILFTWHTAHVPTVPAEERLHVTDIRSPEPGIVLLTARYGYRERIRPVSALVEASALAPGLLPELDIGRAVYYLSLPIVEVVTRRPSRIAREVFALLVRMRTDPVDQLALPRERTIIIGREAQL